MPTLHCPTCGYNLTGLPENRCPECGNVFNVEELQSRLEFQGEDITIPDVLKKILPLPAVFSLSVVALAIHDGVGVVLVLILGIALVIIAPFIAIGLARRFDQSRSRSLPTGVPAFPSAAFIPLCALGLTCCQYGLGFGGCVAASTILNIF